MEKNIPSHNHLCYSGKILLGLFWVAGLSCDKKETALVKEQPSEISRSADALTSVTLRPNVIVEETFEGSTYFPLSGTGLNVVQTIENCGTSWTLSTVTSPVFQQTKSSRFEIRKDQPLVGSGQKVRSEVTLIKGTDDARFSPEMWYSFAMLIPSTGFEYDKTRDCINQWFEDGGDETTLRVEGDRAFIEVTPPSGSSVMKQYDLFATSVGTAGKPSSFNPIPKNSWHEFVFHFKHSLGSDGFIEIWRDGIKIQSIIGRNMHKMLPKWKLGLYKTSFLNKTSSWQSRVIYFDNIRVGKAAAKLEEMSSGLPAGTPPASTNKIPVVSAGRDTAIVLPAPTLYLEGTTYDPDGSVKAVKWSQVSGPEGIIIIGDSTLTPKFWNLQYGKYVIRLTVTDERNGIGTDEMVINVTSSVNIVPVCNAGPDQVITGSSTTLDGTKSADVDGSISKYLWEVSVGVSGWSNFLVMGTPNASKTMVSGLKPGLYTFKLTITDNKGAIATDKVNVTVSTTGQTNLSPTAKAGPDQQITLPATLTLDGSSSTDADGSISKYAWTKVSGSSAAISSPSSAKTSVTGLVQGNYTFRLTVTDNAGATAYDDINVVVYAAAGSASITSFTLVDAATEKDLKTLTNGGVYSISGLGTTKFNIRANATGAASIRFDLSGTQARTYDDSAIPFALMGDDGKGNYYYGNWNPPAIGTFTLKATPYTGTKATGAAGTPLTINFSFAK